MPASRRAASSSPHYDSLLAKVIATGDTRDEAIGRLTGALVDVLFTVCAPTVTTSLRCSRATTSSTATPSTAFVDLHLTLLDAGPGAATVDAHLLAAALVAQRQRRRPPTIIGRTRRADGATYVLSRNP